MNRPHRLRAVPPRRADTGIILRHLKKMDSGVPRVGFPVGCAVSGVLLTVFGYFEMFLSK